MHGSDPLHKRQRVRHPEKLRRRVVRQGSIRLLRTAKRISSLIFSNFICA